MQDFVRTLTASISCGEPAFMRALLYFLFLSPPSQAAIAGVKVSGLKGHNYLNKDPDPKNPIPGVEERYTLNPRGEVYPKP